MRHFKFLLKYISEWKNKLVLSILALTFVSITSLIYPWMLKLMVDQLNVQHTSASQIGILTGLILAFFLISTWLGYYQQVTMHELGFRLRNAIRVSFFDSLLHRSISFHSRQQVGELSSRATEDISKVQPLFINLLSPAYQNTLFICGSIILMLYLHWLASIIIIGMILFLFPILLFSSKQVKKYSSQSQSAHAFAHAIFDESLIAIREIKSFVLEKIFLRKYVENTSQAFHLEIQSSKYHIAINQTLYLLLSLILLGVFAAGTTQTFFPHWNLGSAIAFYFYAYTMIMAVISSGKTFLTYQQIVGALDRIINLLAENDSTEKLRNDSCTDTISGCVEFQNVTFGYKSDEIVLENVSFNIDAGSWILITGPSGSGKSTIANLMMGFYQINNGNMKIDNVPIDKWDLSSLRKQIGLVGQDPILFNGTLRENILLFDESISQHELGRILEASCLNEFVLILPQGLDTIIGERGIRLSGGQKARIAIARAIVHNPAILILDEANAMIESELEKQLWDNLIQFRKKKTTIIMSHHVEHVPKICRHFHCENKNVVEITDQNTNEQLLSFIQFQNV